MKRNISVNSNYELCKHLHEMQVELYLCEILHSVDVEADVDTDYNNITIYYKDLDGNYCEITVDDFEPLSTKRTYARNLAKRISPLLP